MNPKLSVVVITPDNYDTIRKIMSVLHQQDSRGDIEILLCAPTRDAVLPERPEYKDFHSVRILEMGPLKVIAEVKALAVRNASAPIVAFVEEHSFPAAGWARAFIERHEEDHAVVGPMLENPNPKLDISWANFILEYGPWAKPVEGGLRTHLPGNNSCYKRDLLLAYGDRLAAVLDAETLLHWQLSSSGHTLCLDTRAVTRHVNVTNVDSFKSVRFHYSRMFAAQRCKDWGFVKRVIFAGGSILIPAIRFKHHWPDIQRNPSLPKDKFAFWYYVFLGLFASAVGEMVGYSAGAGNARQHVFELEFHRLNHLDPADVVTGLS